MIVKAFQINKKESVYFKDIRDKFAVNINTSTVVLADGTTQSFNSHLFAQILATEIYNGFSLDNKIINETIKESITKFGQIDFEFSKKPAVALIQRAKFETGSTSTFLALTIIDNELQITSVGDCNAFVTYEGLINAAIPFNSRSELDANNSFINTRTYSGIDSVDLYKNQIRLNSNFFILVCSDALSRFLFDNPNQINALIELNSHQDFLSFCEQNWESKLLENDDISLLIINDGENKLIEYLPDSDFKFEVKNNVSELEFRTLSQPFDKEKQNKLTLMEYNELNNKIKKLENEIAFVSTKLKNIERLLIILFVTILMVSILPFVIKTGEQYLTSTVEENHKNEMPQDSQKSVDSSQKKHVLNHTIKSTTAKKNKIKSKVVEKKSTQND